MKWLQMAADVDEDVVATGKLHADGALYVWRLMTSVDALHASHAPAWISEQHNAALKRMGVKFTSELLQNKRPGRVVVSDRVAAVSSSFGGAAYIFRLERVCHPRAPMHRGKPEKETAVVSRQSFEVAATIRERSSSSSPLVQSKQYSHCIRPFCGI